MLNKVGVIKRPCKIIEIDENTTESVFKRTLTSHKIKDETTGKIYRIIRTTNGLQMTGA